MEATNKRPILIAVAASGILLIPLVAMQFTSEVNWNLADFLIAAVLLFGTGALIEVTLRALRSKASRIVASVVLLLLLVLVWAELAVGIFGTPLAGS